MLLTFASYALFFVYLRLLISTKDERLTMMEFVDDGEHLPPFTFSVCNGSDAASAGRFFAQLRRLPLLVNHRRVNFTLGLRYLSAERRPCSVLVLAVQLQPGDELQFKWVGGVWSKYYFHFHLPDSIADGSGACIESMEQPLAIVNVQTMHVQFKLGRRPGRTAGGCQRTTQVTTFDRRLGTSSRRLCTAGCTRPPCDQLIFNYMRTGRDPRATRLPHLKLLRPLLRFTVVKKTDDYVFTMMLVSLFGTFFALNLPQLAGLAERLLLAATGRAKSERLGKLVSIVGAAAGLALFWAESAESLAEYAKSELISQSTLNASFPVRRLRLSVCLAFHENLNRSMFCPGSDCDHYLHANLTLRQLADGTLHRIGELRTTRIYLHGRQKCALVSEEAFQRERSPVAGFQRSSSIFADLGEHLKYKKFSVYASLDGDVYVDESTRVSAFSTLRLVIRDLTGVRWNCTQYDRRGYLSRNHCLSQCLAERYQGRPLAEYPALFTLPVDSATFAAFEHLRPAQADTEVDPGIKRLCDARCAKPDCLQNRLHQIDSIETWSMLVVRLERFVYQMRYRFKQNLLQVLILQLSLLNFTFGLSIASSLDWMRARLQNRRLLGHLRYFLMLLCAIHSLYVLDEYLKQEPVSQISFEQPVDYRPPSFLACHPLYEPALLPGILHRLASTSSNFTGRDAIARYSQTVLPLNGSVFVWDSQWRRRTLAVGQPSVHLRTELFIRSSRICLRLTNLNAFDMSRTPAGRAHLELPMRQWPGFSRLLIARDETHLSAHLTNGFYEYYEYRLQAPPTSACREYPVSRAFARFDRFQRAHRLRYGRSSPHAPIFGEHLDQPIELDRRRNLASLQAVAAEIIRSSRLPDCQQRVHLIFEVDSDSNEARATLPRFVVRVQPSWPFELTHLFLLLLTNLSIWLNLTLPDLLDFLWGLARRCLTNWWRRLVRSNLNS